jgi:hypothetical protein
MHKPETTSHSRTKPHNAALNKQNQAGGYSVAARSVFLPPRMRLTSMTETNAPQSAKHAMMPKTIL